MSSVVASAVLGLLFIVTLTLAIKDIARVSTSASPVATIIHDQLGSVWERILLTGIAFAMLLGGVGGLFPAGTASRKEILTALREA